MHFQVLGIKFCGGKWSTYQIIEVFFHTKVFVNEEYVGVGLETFDYTDEYYTSPCVMNHACQAII